MYSTAPAEWTIKWWCTILLNYNSKMKFLPSKNLGHTYGQTKLIPKYQEDFEKTVIVSFFAENCIGKMIYEVESKNNQRKTKYKSIKA